MISLIMFFMLLAGGMLRSLVVAWGANKIWNWYAADSIGHSPGIWAWFGVIAIINLLFTLNTDNLATKDNDATDVREALTGGLTKMGGSMLGVAIGVGMLWCFGEIAGVIS